MSDDKVRSDFEAWISAPPYEMTTTRQSERESWPGQYIQYEVQLAWEAWQAAQRQGGEAVAYAVIDDDEIIELQENKEYAEYLAQQECGRVVPLYDRAALHQPQPDWIACSERLPTVDDADPYGQVWRKDVGRKVPVLVPWEWVYPIKGDFWTPTGLKRPEPPEDT